MLDYGVDADWLVFTDQKLGLNLDHRSEKHARVQEGASVHELQPKRNALELPAQCPWPRRMQAPQLQGAC